MWISLRTGREVAAGVVLLLLPQVYRSNMWHIYDIVQKPEERVRICEMCTIAAMCDLG